MRCLLLLLLLSSALSAGAESVPLPLAVWEDKVPREAVERRSTELLALARAGEASFLLRAVEDHARAAPLRPAFHEAVLFELARGLAEQPPDPAIAGVLFRLRAHDAVAVAGHPEGRHFGVPAFPVATAAWGALNRWQLEAARDGAAAALAAADERWFLDRAEQPWERGEVAGFGLALSVASPASLQSVLPALEVLWFERPELARTALTAAGVLGSDAPVRAVLAGAGRERLAPFLGRLDEQLPEAAAITIWSELVDHESAQVRSAAACALVAHGDNGPALALLADAEVGAAVALALVRRGQLSSLANVLDDPTAAPSARRTAALGLDLEGSPRSRAVLEAAAARDAVIREWLE